MASKKWRSPKTISLETMASAQPQSTKGLPGRSQGLAVNWGHMEREDSVSRLVSSDMVTFFGDFSLGFFSFCSSPDVELSL